MSGGAVTFTRRFNADLDDIAIYLEAEAGARTASDWVRKIRSAALALGTTPARGAADPELGDGRRRVVVAPYLVV